MTAKITLNNQIAVLNLENRGIIPITKPITNNVN